MQHGFQMEFRTDTLASIAADPGNHPAFDNWRQKIGEEAKDGKLGSKKKQKGIEADKAEALGTTQGKQ